MVLAVTICALADTLWAQSTPSDTASDVPTVVTASIESEQAWIQMFGVRLSVATRDEMRNALRTQGMKVVREDDRYWVDIYDAKGVLNGAAQFLVGYTAAKKQLAFAEYAFANFMDSSHTEQVVKWVSAKYGPSTESAGQLAMGSYTARWRMDDGLLIQVVREWPETSTYLKFINPLVEAEMKAELDKETASRQKNKLASSQNVVVPVSR